MIEKWDDEVKPEGSDRFCPTCGAPRAADARFCAKCGRSFETRPSTPPAASAAPLSTYPVDRKAQAQVYRASVAWSCLGRAMVAGGALIGFVVAGVFAGSALTDNILAELLVGFVIGPAMGAAVGWWLWTELWGR